MQDFVLHAQLEKILVTFINGKDLANIAGHVCSFVA